jgi:hypothetical protein
MIERHPGEPLFTSGDLIHSYSRAQAIADGVLVDVTSWASATTGFSGGFCIPVALTAAVWADVEAIPVRFQGVQDIRGRGHDLLFMAAVAARKAPRRSNLLFQVLLDVGRTRRQTYRLVVGPDDAGEPVVTIMRVEES